MFRFLSPPLIHGVTTPKVMVCRVLFRYSLAVFSTLSLLLLLLLLRVLKEVEDILPVESSKSNLLMRPG